MAAMTRFQPGDRVRYRRTHIGTVVPHAPGDVDLSDLTRVNMDDPVIPNGLYFVARTLRLAGTRCIPFEQMTMQQRRDHLRIAHGYLRNWLDNYDVIATEYVPTHNFAHKHNHPSIVVPHTHRKEPRT